MFVSGLCELTVVSYMCDSNVCVWVRADVWRCIVDHWGDISVIINILNSLTSFFQGSKIQLKPPKHQYGCV